jgi:hypothetical protein
MQAILSGVITIFFYAMIIAAVWKLFSMASDLSEMKTILADIRNNTARAAAAKPVESSLSAASPAGVPAPPPVMAGPISLESAEALLREVAAEEHALTAKQAPVPGPISLESAEAVLREVAAEERALAPKTTA